MDNFNVEQSKPISSKSKREELIKQIESLQNFYCDLGFDSDSIRTIFSLTLSYLRGRVNKLLVKSFFEILITQNKLVSDREFNILNCFEELIENMENHNSAEVHSLGDLSNKKTTQLNLPLKDVA